MGRTSKSDKQKKAEKKLIKHINVHIPKDKMMNKLVSEIPI